MSIKRVFMVEAPEPQTSQLSRVFINETTGNIVRMLGMAEWMAKAFTDIYAKGDFALAKSFKFWLEATYSNQEYCKDVLKGGKDPALVSNLLAMWKREVGADLVDLLKSRPAIEKKINSSKSHGEVLEIIATSQGPVSDAKTLIDMGNGWKWVELTDRHHGKEAQQMQHCATDSRGDLVSLRDAQNNPHVTMTFNKDSNTVFQIKGKQNTSPNQKYWDSIIAFFDKTKADIKDGFIKHRARELFDKIKQTSGKDASPSHEEVYKNLARLIQSNVVKQWAWDTQPFTFENANLDYDDARKVDGQIGNIFKAAGYTSIKVEPSSGYTEVWYHPSAWTRLPDDPQERTKYVPTYKDVEHTWQGITLFRMAQEDIVNKTYGKDFRVFGNKNHPELNQIYNIFRELYESDYDYGIGEAVDDSTDNYVELMDYDELIGFEGASQEPEERLNKEKLDRRWQEFYRKYFFNNREYWQQKYGGDNYYDAPEARAVYDKFRRMQDAGEEPPESLEGFV